MKQKSSIFHFLRIFINVQGSSTAEILHKWNTFVCPDHIKVQNVPVMDQYMYAQRRGRGGGKNISILRSAPACHRNSGKTSPELFVLARLGHLGMHQLCYWAFGPFSILGCLWKWPKWCKNDDFFRHFWRNFYKHAEDLSKKDSVWIFWYYPKYRWSQYLANRMQHISCWGWSGPLKVHP